MLLMHHCRFYKLKNGIEKLSLLGATKYYNVIYFLLILLNKFDIQCFLLMSLSDIISALAGVEKMLKREITYGQDEGLNFARQVFFYRQPLQK